MNEEMYKPRSKGLVRKKEDVLDSEIVGRTDQEYTAENGEKFTITQIWARTLTRTTYVRRAE